MSRKRDRYVVTGDYRVNGIDLKGQVLVDLGACTHSGTSSTKEGDETYRKFRFEQVKEARLIGVPKHFYELTLAEDHVPAFLTKQEES